MKSRTRIFIHIVTILTFLAVFLGSAAFPTSAQAFGATIAVTSILDNTTTDGYCSLREAITNANNNAATSPDCATGIGADAIVFSNLLVVYTVTLSSTLPDVSDPAGLTIYGADTFTVSGNNLYRVFIVAGSASLTLDGLTIANGRATSNVGGGAFNAAGTLTLTNCFFTGNSAISSFGGGVYNVGTLNVTDSIFSNNTATVTSGVGGRGGAIYNATSSTANITRTIFSMNSADIRGGGIYNYFSTVTITDSTLIGNTMTTPGDGGGGIYNDQSGLTITHSTFTNNTANSSGSNGGGIFNSLGVLTVTDSTFSGNSVTTGAGGGIANNGTVTIANSTLLSNYADFGAGIYNAFDGTLTITNDTFSGNTTLNTIVVGGGIYNAGTLNLYNTILANTINGDDCYKYFGTITSSNNLIESTTNACGLTDGVSGNIVGSDPNIGAATFLNPIYLPLNSDSPAINKGDDAKCAAIPVSNTSQNGLTRPQGNQCDIGSYEFPLSVITFTSTAANDGSILESTETSGAGGTMDSVATKLNLGDDVSNKQYRAIFSFDTSSLPDTAVITSVTLKFKYAGVTGTLPFSTHGNLFVDVRKGPLSNNAALQTNDFKAAVSKKNVLLYTNSMVSNWFSGSFASANFQYINLTNVTQFRLRFATDDNNDLGADLLKIYGGNAGASVRPKLIIEYYVP